VFKWSLLVAGVLLSCFSAFSSELTANHGPVQYRLSVTSGDGKGAVIELNMVLKSGDFTGTARITPATALDFGGAVKGYFENGHCVLTIAGPNGRTLQLRGDCTTDSYTGYFESSGRGGRVSGKFSGSGNSAAAPPSTAKLSLPTDLLVCSYMRHTASGQWELSFSNMGSIRLSSNGTYVAGTGVKGTYVREGDQVRLTSGNWKGQIAQIASDRSGQPKLVFHSVDPGVTNCTSKRK
jgi:hypothetical protein